MVASVATDEHCMPAKDMGGRASDVVFASQDPNAKISTL
jgi:hypothetical protein